MRELHRSIVGQLEAAGRESRYASDADEPDPRYRSYGARAAAKRRVFMVHRAQIRSLAAEARVELARLLIESEYGEQQGIAIDVLAELPEFFQPGNLHLIDAFIRRLHGWSKIDGFTGAVVKDVLFRYPQPVIELARSWSRDSDLWLRRASVVLFTRKVAESGRFTDVALELCERLAGDPEVMVQKGVGWALKDIMRSAEDRVVACVKALRAAGAPSVVTLYAIRNLDGSKRQAVLAVKPTDSSSCRASGGSRRNGVPGRDPAH